MKKFYSVEFVFSSENNARIFYKNKKATIYLPTGKATEECVSHELLHLFMETKENMVCGIIHGLILEKQSLRKIFHDDLITHVTNCIHHVKMLPVFCKMGYEKMKFISDSETNKCSIEFANKIKRKFKFFNVYNKSAIDNFIGKYFAMKADVSDVNYQKELNVLSNTNSELFNILDRFWNKWMNYDIDNEKNFDYWLDDFASELIDSLEIWVKNRIIR